MKKLSVLVLSAKRRAGRVRKHQDVTIDPQIMLARIVEGKGESGRDWSEEAGKRNHEKLWNSLRGRAGCSRRRRH